MYKLRELSRDDIETINSWRADKELIDKLGTNYRYIDIEVDKLWFENYLKNRNNTVRCSIVDLNTNSLVGIVTLANIDYINKSAILHIMIGNKQNRGKGAGTYAINNIINHAFNNLNLERVELEVLENNDVAKKLYKKIGFIEEGIKRKAIYKNGNYMNIIAMSILKEEFEQK